MTDEQEFQEHKQDFLALARELGLDLRGSQVEQKLRNIQARAQEHNVPMAEIELRNLRRFLNESIPPEHQD